MQLRDRIRTESVLQRLRWRLSWGMVPARRQRELVRELRAGLEDAAQSGDLDEALARLGGPRELARAYLAALRPRVRWMAGILWAAIAFVLTVWLGIFAASVFAAGLDAANAGPGTYALWPGFAFGGEPLLVEERTADGAMVRATFSFATPLHLGAMLLAFIAASRPWRALHRNP